MNLLQQATAINEGKYYGIPTSVKEMLTAMNSQLKGMVVPTFGKKGKGLWGASDEEQNFEITKVVGHFFDEDYYGNIDVYLKGYSAKKNGLIYTDKTFLASLKMHLKEEGLSGFIKSVDFSEQGMQGSNYVNLDIEFKVPKK